MKKNILGDRLRIAHVMQKPPLSQQALATKCQIAGYNAITQKIISKIECGTRYVTDLELYQFSRALNVSISWLMEKEEESTD